MRFDITYSNLAVLQMSLWTDRTLTCLFSHDGSDGSNSHVDFIDKRELCNQKKRKEMNFILYSREVIYTYRKSQPVFLMTNELNFLNKFFPSWSKLVLVITTKKYICKRNVFRYVQSC